MDTDLVLDLFKHTTEHEERSHQRREKRTEKEHALGNSKNILDGLEDLPTEEEYQDLELSSFMSSIGR